MTQNLEHYHSAQLSTGQPLPEWLKFDPAMATFSKTVITPDIDAQIARVNVTFTPDNPSVAPYYIEVRIDPTQNINPQLNALFQNDRYFENQGLRVLNIARDAAVSASEADQTILPDWLKFDARTLTFSGTPPEKYVGVLPVRIDIGASVETGQPAFALIQEIIIDETIDLANGGGFRVTTFDELIDLVRPPDFYGSFAIEYTARDEKDGIATDPAIIVINVEAQPELPDAGSDNFQVNEDQKIVISLTDLLVNDRDDDGDIVRIISFGDPDFGSIEIIIPELDIDLPGIAGGTYSVLLSDGKPLPDWLQIDQVNGALAGTPPLDFSGTLSLNVTRSDADENVETLMEININGNRGAKIIYTTEPDYSGPVSFTYELTDDAQGSVNGQVNIDVIPANDPPVAVDDHFSGVEDTPIMLTQAQLTSNDTDVDNNPLRVSSVFNAINGSVELVDGQITFTPDMNFSGTASFEYTVTDDVDGDDTGFVELNITPNNSAPVTGSDLFEGVEDTPFIITIEGLMANDNDPEGDQISFVSFGDEVVDGVIQMLPDGTYAITPRGNFNGEIAFTYIIGDGRLESVEKGNIVVNFAAVNDMPTPEDDGIYTIVEDAEFSISLDGLIANDKDVDGDTLTVTRVLDPVNGTVRIEDGLAIFTPALHYFGNGGFSYEVSDGNGATAIAFVSVFITPENNSPSAVNDKGFSTIEDNYVDIRVSDILLNDMDPDGDTISLVGVTGATLIDSGTIRFTPAENANGRVSFSYTISDGASADVSGVVYVDILPINDAPVVAAALVDQSSGEDTAVSFTLPAGAFTDVDGDALSLMALLSDGSALPAWLNFDAATRSFTGTPPTDFNGSLDIKVTASDGSLTVSDIFNLNIENVNDAPVAVDDVLEATEGQVLVIPVLRLLENDKDIDGDTISISSLLEGTGYIAEFDGNGNILVNFDPGLNGEVTLGYEITDGNLKDTGSVLINVKAVNHAPTVATLPDVQFDEDTAIEFDLPQGFASDKDGDIITLGATRAGGAPLPSWLSVDRTTGRFTGTPPANFFGTIALAVIATDGKSSTASEFNLTINPLNDAPIITMPFSDRFVNEDESFTIQLQQNLFEDVDGDALDYSIELADGSALPGWLVADLVSLQLSGIAPADFNGELDIRVTASDGSASVSDIFTFTVNGVNDAPYLVNELPDVPDTGKILKTGKTFTVDIPADTFADVDGDILAYSATLADGSPLPDWLTFDGSVLTGTAPSTAGSRTISIEVSATDGAYTASDVFNLTFKKGNSAPIAVNDGIFGTRGKIPINIDSERLLENDTDSDGDELDIVNVGQGKHGVVSIDNKGQITYIAESGFIGDDEFTYQVSDGVASDLATVHVRVFEAYDKVKTGTDSGDFLSGGRGEDLLIGLDGNDILYGASGDDTLEGGNGDDTLTGGQGNDTLNGGSGNDLLSGGKGVDQINGGTGDDRLIGGLGSDVFTFATGGGSDTIIDFQMSKSGRRFSIAGDQINLNVNGVDNFDDLLATGQQQNGGVLFDFAGDDQLFLLGTRLSALDEDSFTFF